MLKIAVLVSGGGTNLQAIIDGIVSGAVAGAQISVVVSNNKNAFALERAARAGIPNECVSPKDYESRADFYDALFSVVDRAGVDLIVLAGFLVFIPERMVRRYRNRIINIHPSLIPAFCGPGCYGLKVHEQVLARGVKVTGATCHFVDEGCDTGPIILQKAVQVKPGDTPKLLQRRVMEQAEWVILPRAINLIAGGMVSVRDGRVYIKGETS